MAGQNPASYFLPEKLDTKFKLPAMPQPDSNQQNHDLELSHQYQNSRTPQDCERAQSEVAVNLATFFGPPYGKLSNDEVSQLNVFAEKIRLDTDRVVQKLKVRLNRSRPYLADPTLTPCVRKETTGSYPSGHAAISRVLGRSLAEIYPDRRTEFLRRADQIAMDRVIAGVHFVSDIESGKVLGEAIFQELLKSQTFRNELRKVHEFERTRAWPQVKKTGL